MQVPLPTGTEDVRMSDLWGAASEDPKIIRLSPPPTWPPDLAPPRRVMADQTKRGPTRRMMALSKSCLEVHHHAFQNA